MTDQRRKHIEALAPRVGRAKASKAFGVPLRTERQKRHVDKAKTHCEKARHATPATHTCRWCKQTSTNMHIPTSRIPDEQRSRIYELLCSDRFMDLPAEQVYYELLDEGTYLCSIRSMYRILAEHGANHERRRGRHQQPKTHTTPQLRATQPNQVWCWDVTLLPTTTKGKFFYVYCIIDLYSRKIVGWMIDTQESQHNAEELLQQTCTKRNISSDQLTIHADRGAIQRADTVQKLMATRGVLPSYSRPRVSNDNAFIESFFKTLKYHHDYPLFFATLQDARWWIATFIGWYNKNHHHRGLHGYTPNQVDDRSWKDVQTQRQAALDAAYQAHPERFHKPSVAKTPPEEVTLNIRAIAEHVETDVMEPTTEEVVPIGS